MTKGLKLLVFLFTTLLLTGCGLTEELEQAKSEVKDLNTNLANQKDYYKTLEQLIELLPSDFDSDVKKLSKEELLTNKEGAIYRNLTLRQELQPKMAAEQAQIKKKQRRLQTIIKRHAADVDNKQLKRLSNSLDIIMSNFESLEVYQTTITKQETAFYDDFPSDDLDEQLFIIEQTYGALDLVCQEAQANINYAQSLVKQFEKDAIKSKATHT